MTKKIIYLDNSATTKVDPKALEAMMPYFTEKFGNPSSNHEYGLEAEDALIESRRIIAKAIGAKEEEIIFTSGGTESNNFALKGIAFANREKGNHIITSKIEHSAILKVCQWLERQGFEVSYLDVDEEGFVNPEDIRKAITDKTILVSIMHANNEIGTIQDLKTIGEICKEKNIYFHTDACQSFTKEKIDVKEYNLDLVSLNSHKINGPKGVGALYIRKGTTIDPLLHGGPQEFRLRGGTENIPGIVGFAEATKEGLKKGHIERMTRLRDHIINEVLNNIEGTKLNGPSGDKRLCNNINIAFKAIEGEALGGLLNVKNIATSTASACSSLTLDPSHVLKAIHLTDEEANGSLRISLSRFTSEEEVEKLLTELPGVVEKLRRISPFGKLLKKISPN
jgi:cysteine desulfurase